MDGEERPRELLRPTRVRGDVPTLAEQSVMAEVVPVVHP